MPDTIVPPVPDPDVPVVPPEPITVVQGMPPAPIVPTVVPPEPDPIPEPIVAPVTGVPFYDNAGTILAAAGMNPTDTLNLISDNGGEVTTELREGLVKSLGESQTFMLEQGLLTQQAKESTERTAVFDSVGGEAEWTKISEWTNTEQCKLTSEQTTQFNSMLAKGGKESLDAAKQIKEAYMSDPAVVVPAVTALAGDAVIPTISTVQHISRAVYMKEKSAAIRDGNGVAVQALEARARHTSQKQPNLWRPVRGDY